MPPAGAPSPPRPTRLHVLVIEDDRAVRELLRLMLERALPDMDLRIELAGSATEGFLRLGKHRPDLILLDLRLPDVHGRTVVRSLRATPELNDIPLIVVSAEAHLIRDDTRVAAALPKPVSLEALGSAVRAALGRPGPL